MGVEPSENRSGGGIMSHSAFVTGTLSSSTFKLPFLQSHWDLICGI